MIKIRQAFEVAVNAITPLIATKYENMSFTPTVGVPYQELYTIPADKSHLFVDDAGYKDTGIFQITLKYPSGTGMGVIMARADLYVTSFKVGTKLKKDDVTVHITDTPDITVLGVNGDRFTVAVSINYKSYI